MPAGPELPREAPWTDYAGFRRHKIAECERLGALAPPDRILAALYEQAVVERARARAVGEVLAWKAEHPAKGVTA